MLFRITLVVLFFFSGLTAGAQIRVLNNVSPKVKWYQVNTPHFKIIYPEGFNKQGLRMANTMEHIYKPGAASLSVEPRENIPIILQNHTTVSNGFVALGPRRSEFFTMSPNQPDLLGNNDWLNMLAVHEYRHIVQYDKSRVGFTGFLATIFGEYTQSAVAGATVPKWYWEGDAVAVETALSPSGRGRIPEFSAVFRASLLEKGPFNYNKAYLRSFKDFIPNHYVLGYHYTNYLRETYGSEPVANMVRRTWQHPYIPFAFSYAQKKYGDKKMPEMYQEMMADLKKKWTDQQNALEITAFEKVNSARKKVFTRYDFPQFLDNGNLVVLKSGIGDYPQLMEIDINTGEEIRLFTPGVISSAGMLSAAGGTVVWNEFQYDPRWRRENFTVIKAFNSGTREVRRVTAKTRYNAATLSPDRELVGTVEQLDDYTNTVVILGAYSGEVEQRFEWPEGSALSNPVWSDQENILVAEIRGGMKRLVEINVPTGERIELLAPTSEQISYAFRKDDLLFYVSGITGIDNIYAKNLSSGEKYQVTSSRFGAYSPVLSPDGKTLYYTDLNSMGTDVVKIDLDQQSWTNLKNLADTDVRLYEAVVEQEANPDILENIPENNYPEARYRKKLGKLHSWGPYFTSTAFELEAGLYSTNLLSTTDLFLGFRFDVDRNFKWLTRASFQALYPILDIEASYGKRNQSINYRDTTVTETVAIETDQLNWNETTLKTGLRFPWLLTDGNFHTNLEIRNYFGYTAVRDYQSDAFGDSRYFLYFSNLADGNLLSNEFRFLFSMMHAVSQRDIVSKWGAVLLFENYGTPYGGDYQGGLTAIRGQFYFPGFFKHHSINFLAGYQHNDITLDDNNYWFANRMPYPRGVSGSTHEDFYTLRTNYDLPIWYADLSLGPWVYIQRMKAQLFYDYGFGKIDPKQGNTGIRLTEQVTRTYYSTGFELTFDFNFMRAQPLLEMGVRFAYLPDLNTSTVELLVGSFGF